MTKAFATAFEEWLRRYEQEPEKYAKEYGDPTDYGATAARYFEKLLNDLSGGKPWNTIGA
jgi:hypothetical protein